MSSGMHQAAPVGRVEHARRPDSPASASSAARNGLRCSRCRSPRGRRWPRPARAPGALRACAGAASMRSVSRPVASELPSSFSSSCRFTSQAPRGSALARPRMPAGWPLHAEAKSAAPSRSAARRGAWPRPAGRGAGAALSRISERRRCSRRPLSHGIGVEGGAAPGFHPALRQRAVRGVDLVDGRAVGREQPDEGGVHAGGIAQGIEAVADAGVDGAAAHVLQVDGDFGAGDIDAQRRLAAAR